MSEDRETHEQEAREQLASRIAEMHVYLSAAEDERDVWDDDAMADRGNGDLYSLADYGLEWTKATTNHRDGTVTYVHVLSTGGPHDEFQVEFDGKGSVESVTFVYLPWGDRVEIDALNSYDIDPSSPATAGAGTVRDFYESFYGDIIDTGGLS
jgi:hypothetical protein